MSKNTYTAFTFSDGRPPGNRKVNCESTPIYSEDQKTLLYTRYTIVIEEEKQTGAQNNP